MLHGQLRTLTDREGREIPIYFHSSTGDSVRFIRTDTGRDFQVPIDRLSSKSITDIEEWKKQPYEGGIEELRMTLASNYFDGTGGVEENKEKAFKVFKISAEKGVPFAQLMIGLMYAEGSGAIESGALAEVWITRAADSGYTKAESQIGWLYMNGQSFAKNYDKAATYLTRASDKGDPHAKAGLGILYVYGSGVAKDSTKGLALIMEAAKEGHEGATQFLKEYKPNATVASKTQPGRSYEEDSFGSYVSDLLLSAASRYGESSAQVKRLKFTKNFYYYLKEQYPNDQISFLIPDGQTDQLNIYLSGITFMQYEYFEIAWWVMSTTAPSIAGVKNFSDMDNKLHFESIKLYADSSTPEYNGYDLVIWYERHWEGKENFNQ